MYLISASPVKERRKRTFLGDRGTVSGLRTDGRNGEIDAFARRGEEESRDSAQRHAPPIKSASTYTCFPEYKAVLLKIADF